MTWKNIDQNLKDDHSDMIGHETKIINLHIESEENKLMFTKRESEANPEQMYKLLNHLTESCPTNKQNLVLRIP